MEGLRSPARGGSFEFMLMSEKPWQEGSISNPSPILCKHLSPRQPSFASYVGREGEEGAAELVMPRVNSQLIRGEEHRCNVISH